MPPVGFEPTIPASERPQTHALDSAATEGRRLNPYVAYYCACIILHFAQLSRNSEYCIFKK